MRGSEPPDRSGRRDLARFRSVSRSAVNDEHNWAARGTLALPAARHGAGALPERPRQPARPGLDARTGDRHANACRGSSSASASPAGIELGYADRDVREEFEELCRDTIPSSGSVICANPFAHQQLAKQLAEDRPLDKRPYRGDYDRVGQTTRDTWGGFVSGEGELFADTKLFALASYDQYERVQDQDTDFTPESAVRGDPERRGVADVRRAATRRRARRRSRSSGSVGGYYLQEELDNDRTIFVGTVEPARHRRYPAHLQPDDRQLRRRGASSAGTSPTTSRSKAACDGTGSARSSTSGQIGGLQSDAAT